MEEQIVKLTGRPVSEEMRDILNRLSRKESVEIDEINNTIEIKTARSNVDYSRPTIQLDNRFEIQANALNQMNKLGSATIDENGNTIYNGDVAKGSRLDIIIGLPASGKSSAIVDSLSQEFHSKVIDNDEAKKMIPQYNNGWGAGVVHEESQKISDVAFRIALAKHENVILPKVGSNAERLLSDYIEPAAEVGYKVNVHFVDLDRNKALGRMINRFIEEGRFLDPNLIDNYCNEREGNKIEKAYEQLKESDFVQGFSRWDNDVERGEKPILVEYSNLEGNYIDNARTGDVNYERENEHTKGSRTNSGNSRESRGNEPQSSHANESGQRTDNSRYDTGRSFNDNGQILQEGQLREKEKIAAEIAEFIAINENAKYWHNEFADRSAIQDTISKELQDLQIDKINSRIDHVIRTNEEYWSEYSEEELSHVPAESITEVPQKAEELKENLTAFVEKINLYEIDRINKEPSKYTLSFYDNRTGEIEHQQSFNSVFELNIKDIETVPGNHARYELKNENNEILIEDEFLWENYVSEILSAVKENEGLDGNTSQNDVYRKKREENRKEVESGKERYEYIHTSASFSEPYLIWDNYINDYALNEDGSLCGFSLENVIAEEVEKRNLHVLSEKLNEFYQKNAPADVAQEVSADMIYDDLTNGKFESYINHIKESLEFIPDEDDFEDIYELQETGKDILTQLEKHSPAEIDILITEQSKNIHIEGHKGTYSVVQSDIIDGQKAYLLKSDIESDEMEISDIVCDEKGNVLLNEVWANGLDEYKSNIFFDRNQLSEEIIHEWEEENDMKISNELDSMIYDLSHDHSLTKEKFAEMVYQIIEDFENKIVSPLEVTHLSDNQMSILSTEQFMEDVSAGVSGITLNGTILSETANYTNFSNRVYNVVQEYEDNKDNTDIVQAAQNIYFDTSVGQIALADIEIPSGKYNLGEDYYIANIEGIETNYTAAFSAFEIAGVRINDIYLSTQSTNPEYKMVLAKMEQENEKSAFRCYQANDKQGYNVLFTQDTTMEHEKQIGFFIEDTSGVAIASGVAAMSNHAGAKLITEEFGIFGKDSDVVFYEINDKAEVADIEQRSTQIENLPIKVECEQHSGSEVIAQDVTYCADNATASSYAEYISNIPNNNTDMHINIAVRSDIEEKEIREMLESTEQYRAYKFFDSVDEEIDFLVIESDKDTKQVNISIYDNNLDKVSETTLSYPNEAAFGATQKEFSLSNLMNSQEFQNAPDKGYIEKTFNQVWKLEKVNAEELMSDINDKHALEVGKEIVDKANLEKGDRILTLYDKQTGKVNFQQSFNDLSEVNLFDLQLAAKGWDRYEVTDTENKILVKGEVDSDMESIIEDTLTQLDSPDTDEMVGRYTITLYDKETGSIQFQQFFDEVSELDIDELRHSIDGDNYFEIEDEKGIVLTEGNVDGDMLEIIKSSLLMSNNDRTADMELTAAKQAENLINQLEGNATIFTNEERNLIVNYAYKFDDMEKTKELAEKIAYLQTEDEPSEKAAVIKEANKEIDMLPDSMVGLSEMHEYGYTWEEMLPLTQERAAELFDKNVAVYQLYSDGSERLVENVQDVKEDERNFQLMFGVEKKDWKAYLENDTIKKDNPLNKVEELVEGNYNQIDGIINNTPPLEDKEEKELTFKERIAQAKEQSDKTEQSRENKKERPSHSAPSLD